MPTGVAIRDARRHLFEAAERVLLRDGPEGLTSRAVTTEAGVAKGVLHRHFADFDAFLADLVRDRIARVQARSASVDDLAAALDDVFDPVTVGIVKLITFRDGLRERLRATHPTGIPLLAEITDMVAGHLTAHQQADPTKKAMLIVGGTHLIFAGSRPGTRPGRAEITAVVESVLR